MDLGTRPYPEVWAFQKELLQKRIQGEVRDTLILVEHPSVITKGRRSAAGEILDSRFPVYEVERGGRVTYHGPGQLVGYPIMSLGIRNRSVKTYLRSLEEVLIRTLQAYDIVAVRRENASASASSHEADRLFPAFGRSQNATGVWVHHKKIASIGVAIKKWVSYHGFALNVSTDLSAFESIHPCGFESSVMTSMRELCGRSIPLSEVKEHLLIFFREVFFS